MKTFLFGLVLLSGLMFLSSCSTMKGVGRDIEDVGDSIQDAAN